MPRIVPSILTEKYRPTSIEEFVFPTQHKLGAALDFLKEPYPSAWLLHGDSGLGKTTMARLMANAAAKDPHAIITLDGEEVDMARARKLRKVCRVGMVWGKIPTIIVDEAHRISEDVTEALLGIIETLHYSVWIFTTTQPLEKFTDTFFSRLIPQHFTAQGLSGRATKRIREIAEKEGIELSAAKAAKLIKDAQNNLRSAIQGLHVIGAEARHRAFSHTDECLDQAA